MIAMLAGCGDDSGSPSAEAGAQSADGEQPSDPGPNATTDDPGPNDTSDGPETVQGTVVLEESLDCITLATEQADLEVRISGYELGRDADGPAVVRVGGEPIARDGDSMIVAGYPVSAEGDCGSIFDAESLVNVTPAG